MDAKCNRLMQSESREVVNARKASFYICLGPMPAGGIKRCTVYRNHAGETAFSCDARFLQNTTKGIHSGYLVSKPVYILKCIGCKMKALWTGVEQESFTVCICILKYLFFLFAFWNFFLSLFILNYLFSSLHFEISSQLPPLSSKLALPQTQKWLVAKYQYSSSRDQRQKHQGMHKLYSVWYTFLQT